MNGFRFPQYWPEGSEWQGNAKVGDYIAIARHQGLFQLIAQPDGIARRADLVAGAMDLAQQ